MLYMPCGPIFADTFTCRGVVLLGALNKRPAFTYKNEKSKTYLQSYCEKKHTKFEHFHNILKGMTDPRKMSYQHIIQLNYPTQCIAR